MPFHSVICITSGSNAMDSFFLLQGPFFCFFVRPVDFEWMPGILDFTLLGTLFGFYFIEHCVLFPGTGVELHVRFPLTFQECCEAEVGPRDSRACPCPRQSGALLHAVPGRLCAGSVLCSAWWERRTPCPWELFLLGKDACGIDEN